MIDDVQKLRRVTGAGVMDCKRALEEAGGDILKAVEILKEKGLLQAKKREGRSTDAGMIEAYVHNDRIGVLLELKSETDFVARSTPFRELSHELAMQVAAMAPENVAVLLDQPYIKDESIKVEDLIKKVIAQVGENIVVEKFCRYEL